MQSPTAPSDPPDGSLSRSEDKTDSYIEDMLQWRNAVCHEHALTINHTHCIGCELVLRYMQKEHPNVEAGTQKQWELEAAFCLIHERDIIKEFIRSRSKG